MWAHALKKDEKCWWKGNWIHVSSFLFWSLLRLGCVPPKCRKYIMGLWFMEDLSFHFLFYCDMTVLKREVEDLWLHSIAAGEEKGLLLLMRQVWVLVTHSLQNRGSVENCALLFTNNTQVIAYRKLKFTSFPTRCLCCECSYRCVHGCLGERAYSEASHLDHCIWFNLMICGVQFTWPFVHYDPEKEELGA